MSKNLFTYGDVSFDFVYGKDWAIVRSTKLKDGTVLVRFVPQPMTTVVATNLVTGAVQQASVSCYYKDAYVKAEGRKHALAKLMKGIRSKKARTEIWTKFFEVFPRK